MGAPRKSVFSMEFVRLMRQFTKFTPEQREYAVTELRRMRAERKRLVWGRSVAESQALAAREAAARRARLFPDQNGCFIVHAPEIEGSYCEIHRTAILPGESDTLHLTERNT